MQLAKGNAMTIKNVIRRCCWIALLLFLAGSAHAMEVVVAKVTVIEPSYMPNAVVFQIDGALPSCPTGTWLRWERDADSNKAILASLLTATATGRRIRFYIADGDISCRGLHLHVLTS